MKPMTKSYFVLSLIVLVAVSCGPVTPVSLISTNTPISPIQPTAMFTQAPTLTPTPHQTIAASPTSFLPSSWEYSPPSFSPSAYKLKPWAEADFAFFINSMNTGELFDFYPIWLPVFDSFYGYEYLLYSDQVDSNDDLVWTIAQMNPRGIPLPGMRRDEEYFNFLIERLLNNANVPLAKLRGILKRHGFGVTNTYIVKDFYGEGENAFFFDVMNENGYLNIGAIFAVRSLNGIYQVDTIKNWQWMFGLGLGRDYSFEGMVDTNKNNFPELVIEEYEGHSGTPPTGKLTVSLYEWNSQSKDYKANSFIIFDTWECRAGACDGKWEVMDMGSNAIPAFIVQEYYPTQRGCPDLIMQRTYRWDEHGYPLQKNSILPPSSEKVECMIDWAEARIRFQDHGWQDNQAIQIISDALEQWPAAMDKDWGPASRDYFRLQLGIWKDLRGEQDDALRLLESLAATPFLADYLLPSQAARAYLDERKSNGLINACQKANDVWSSAINKEFPGFFVYLPVDEIRNFLGFANGHWGYSIYDFSSVCSEDNTIFATARDLKNNEAANPAKWFTGAGRSVYVARQADFNRDGKQDWLIIAQRTEDSEFTTEWFFFGASNGFNAHELDVLFDGSPSSVWRVIQPDRESDPVYFIQSEESLWIFRVNSDNQIETLVDDYNIRLLQIDQSNGTKIKVSATDWDYKGEKIKNYVWNSPSQTFVTVVEEYDFEGARQRVEQMIFQEHDYASAISAIQQFLAEAPTEYLETSSCTLDVCEYYPQRYYPGMYYLIGVAYEMSGQPEQAARAYYILWRDYPDSPYALLAQNKLEPVKP